MALAEGIGLYRTEFEFFAADRLLTEDEQFEKYSAVLRAMDGRPVTFRLLDLGGDKTAPFLNMQPEQNPALGFRGGAPRRWRARNCGAPRPGRWRGRRRWGRCRCFTR